MARIKKKGTSGQAKNYITRTQAVRKLQISLPDFRRLCIFKGIYPREPRNKKKASKSSTPSTTFYYTKDIQYLLHEPLLAKFREHKALAKKIGKALGRGEVGDAARLEKLHTPRIALDHIIKERYPTFVDALRDLDDALSMIFLFANLPSTSHVPPKTISLCQRLAHEFEHYLIITHSLRKSFLSIKGIYYQATIQGQDILWLVPYKFVQNISADIDFRIMATFLEFYTTLLGFVNYRLYTSIGLIYPPRYDSKSDEKGGELGAFTLKGRDPDDPQKQIEANNQEAEGRSEDINKATTHAQEVANSLGNSLEMDSASHLNEARDSDNEDEETNNNTRNNQSSSLDTFTQSTSLDADTLQQPTLSSETYGHLFEDFTFYLSRETPRAPLEFLLRAFGCKRIGWDAVLGDNAFTHDESDPAITHQVVDRPPVITPAHNDRSNDDANSMEGVEQKKASFAHGLRAPGRTYIQPQWIWDCINEGRLLRPDLYAPGATLPPHLSPWVKPERGEYDPKLPIEEQVNDIEIQDKEETNRIEGEAGRKVLENGHEDSDSQEIEEDSEEQLSDSDSNIEQDDHQTSAKAKTEDWTGFSSSEEEEEPDNTTSYQSDLQSEAQGKTTPENKKPLKSALKKGSKPNPAELERLEHIERQKMMMPRRKRKLFERMQFGNEKRDLERERLVGKRRRIEGRGK